MSKSTMDKMPMFNAYPDSIGGNLKELAEVLSSEELKDLFGTFYILPSLFHSDLDRGFSVIDYDLNEEYATKEDLKKLQQLGMDLKLDFILNHASVQSPQFQDLLKNGEKSEYKDFFINWNEFWAGCGEMTEEGYIQPKQKYLDKMFFRKPGLPILMVTMPDGKKVPYWNTFYQEVKETEDGYSYLGQMDLNIKSPLVWKFYQDVMGKLAGYGAKIVRLDAFAYAPKEPGEKNFLNDPGTWDFLNEIFKLAEPYHVSLLPEIHASYEEKIYETVAEKGYATYDFFLPGLIIDALETGSGDVLVKWAEEINEKQIQTVNMLGCHDGIPLLDLKGLIPEERIGQLIDTIVSHGGFVKNLHGQKNVYYQVNATYYSALGEDDRKMLLARALQLFMPGKPQIWYLDLFAGKNDHEAVKRAGAGGHKEINRTNLSVSDVKESLKKDVVKNQIQMIRFRKQFGAFAEGAKQRFLSNDAKIYMSWEKGEKKAVLRADLKNFSFEIRGLEGEKEVFTQIQ